MVDKLKPGSQAFLKRNARWRHNSYLGSCSMAKQNMRAILNSNTTTDAAKAIAVRIENDLEFLLDALKVRKPGT